MEKAIKMKKKMLLFAMLAVFMLVAVSFAGSVSSNVEKNNVKKISPLYNVRTKSSTGQTFGNLKWIEVKGLGNGNRLVFLPIQKPDQQLSLRDRMSLKSVLHLFSACCGTCMTPFCSHTMK